MKYVVILGDGMAGYPLKEFGGKTTMEKSSTPALDSIAPKSRMGLAHTIPDSLPADSAVANLSVMGYPPEKYFHGRGVLEAANMGVEFGENDVALRCNVICIEDRKIKSHSAGHIANEESHELIGFLNEKLSPGEKCRFYPGVSYRHLLVLKNASPDLECSPPHDHLDEEFEKLLPKAKSDEAKPAAELLGELIKKSIEILPGHPVNRKRKEEGKQQANSIWPWAPGRKPAMPNFEGKYGKKGAIISAVDLVKGVGVYAGMEVLNVEGATGLHDTNYEGKAQACLDALERNDFVYVHVEASDEAGHEGDAGLKVKCIEYLDQRLVKPVLKGLKEKYGDEFAVMVLPDHPTPIEIRTHTREPVPFMIYSPKIREGDGIERLTEKLAAKGGFGTLRGTELLGKMFSIT